MSSMPPRVGPYGMLMPNVAGMLSMRIPGQFGTGYGLLGMPGMNPFRGPGAHHPGMQAGRFGQPAPVNQGPGAQMPIARTPFEGQQNPSTIAGLRLLGKKM